jgi:hypothetical protein
VQLQQQLLLRLARAPSPPWLHASALPAASAATDIGRKNSTLYIKLLRNNVCVKDWH